MRPGPVRIGGAVVKGYQIVRSEISAGLGDAWTRYLPPPGEDPSGGYAVTAVTPQVRPVTAAGAVTAASVTPPVEPRADDQPTPDRVTDLPVTPHPSVTPLTRHVTAVTDVTAPEGTRGAER